MKKLFAILGICALAAGCTQSRVVRDNSVAAQFSRLNGIAGARVTTGGASVQVTNAPTASPRPGDASQLLRNAYANTGNSTPIINPFTHAVWSTNLNVTAPASTGTTFSTASGVQTQITAPHGGTAQVTTANGGQIQVNTPRGGQVQINGGAPNNTMLDGLVPMQGQNAGPSVTVQGPPGKVVQVLPATRITPGVNFGPTGVTFTPAQPLFPPPKN
jgi:hypothetical protein